MKLFELFESPVIAGANNLKAIAQAATSASDAHITLGGEPITLEYPEARFIYGLYKRSLQSGTQEQFLQMLTNPAAFDNLMKPMRNMLYKDRGPEMAQAAAQRIGQPGVDESVDKPTSSSETMKHIVQRFPKEVKDFVAGGDLDTDLYHALYDYYSMHGEMPYGTMKARDGDPFEWVTQHFDRDVHDYITEAKIAYKKLITEGRKQGVAEGAEATTSTLDSVFNEHDFYRLEHIWPALEAGDKKEALRQINHYLIKGKNRAWWGDLQALDIQINPNDIENSMVAWSKPVQQGMSEGQLDERWDDDDDDWYGFNDKTRRAATGGTVTQTGRGVVHKGKYGSEYQGDDEEEKSPFDILKTAKVEKEPRGRGRPGMHVKTTAGGGVAITAYTSWYHKSKRTYPERKVIGSPDKAAAVVPKGNKFAIVGSWDGASGVIDAKAGKVMTLDQLKAEYPSKRGRPKTRAEGMKTRGRMVREWIEQLRMVAEGQ